MNHVAKTTTAVILLLVSGCTPLPAQISDLFAEFARDVVLFLLW